jgi:hypothetical protein
MEGPLLFTLNIFEPPWFVKVQLSDCESLSYCAGYVVSFDLVNLQRGQFLETAGLAVEFKARSANAFFS